jgi:transcriptional regulator with XRE-family HTH domain
MKTLGEELRTVRELRRLSLRDVESATGISNAYLSQLENDKIKKPSPHFLSKLANLYDLKYEGVMQAAGYVAPREKPEGPRTLAGEALWSGCDLSAEEEEKLLEYLRFMRSQRKSA